MATKPLKTIKFPTLPNTYTIPQVDATLAQTGQAADAKVTGDEISSLKEDLSDTQEWLGYSKNLFNVTFTTTHPSNWSINQDGNDVTFTHNTQWSSGEPRTEALGLSAGTYHFSANYNGGTNLLALYKETNTWVKTLTGNDDIIIESGNTYYIRIGVELAQGASVTVSDIMITAAGVSAGGKIGEIESEIDTMQSSVSNVDALVSSAKETIQPVSDTVYTFINNAGVITTTESAYFYVAKYTVEAGKNYWIDASTKWSNAYWAWYNGETLVSVGQISPAELTAIQNVAVTAPSGANVLYVAHHTQSINAKLEKNRTWL